VKSSPLIALISLIAWLPNAASGQSPTTPSKAQRLADAIRRVQENDLGTGYVDALSNVYIIADAQAVEAIPILEKYYGRTSDPEIKAGVASALVRMGDRDDAYWDYLVKLATPALESDAPYPLNLHPANENDHVSPEFQAWATSHNLSIESATHLVMMDLPGKLAPLAQSGDARGVRMLRLALTSSNIMIATLGAAGLAEAQDKASIPLIIDACRNAPPSMAHFFADSLLFFDDPDAERTFAMYFPGVNIKEARKFRCGKPFVHTCQSE